VGIVGAEHLPASPKLFDNDVMMEEKSETAPGGADPVPVKVRVLAEDGETALKTKTVDALVVVPPGFRDTIQDATAPKPKLVLKTREGDDKSKLLGSRLTRMLRSWEGTLRAERFEKANLPKNFDRIFILEDPQTNKPQGKRAADELRDSFVKIFPFMLIMWLVAGAIQPAVDITAGERERGTMETLLISPVSRAEIVTGKWLAATVFGFISVVWNVVWMLIGAVVMERVLENPIVNYVGLIGCVLMGIPLAMLFSALSIALGVFAKSTKEGQYYLVPLIIVTLPLAFGSMVPGAELTFGQAMVPVTGAMVLQQKMLALTGDPFPWRMVPVVLGFLALWVVLALWLAVRQFHRESVLFREGGGGGWWKRKTTAGSAS
jgi:sodium transport system permease protein